MVNKLYSILVTGCSNIPESFAMYRKNSSLQRIVEGVPDYTDPYRRSLWANYMIELSKSSVIYSKISELDPINTYRTKPAPLKFEVSATGFSVGKLSMYYPILHIDGHVEDNTFIYSCNNAGSNFVTIPDTRIIETLGFELLLSKDAKVVNGYIENPAVTIQAPEKDIIHKAHNVLKDVYQHLDTENPCDTAAAFCLYALRSYDGYK